MTPGSPDAGSVEYELFGILIHLTVQNLTTFGHYVSVVKGVDGQWYVGHVARVESAARLFAVACHADINAVTLGL
jgi:hypothetical protein